MVYRIWLALILTLCLSGLFAQTEPLSTPPRVIRQVPVKLPRNWDFQYEKMEVLVKLVVYPDSSATLSRIQDQKIELEELIRESLPQMLFSPMFKDGTAIQSEMYLLLKLEQTEQLPEDYKVFPMNRDILAGWISEEMVEYNLFRPRIRDPFSSPMLGQLDLYRHNYNSVGLTSDRLQLYDSGFAYSPFIFNQALYLQYLHTFKRAEPQNTKLDFGSPVYGQAAPITDIQVGLGDYEYSFARGSIAKNHILDTEDLFASFDFLVQNGYWSEAIADQTSMRLKLRIPYRLLALNTEFEIYEQNVAMTQLDPIFWETSLYRIDHRRDALSLHLDNPWLSIAFRNEHEKATSPRFKINPQQDIQHLMISKSLVLGSPGNFSLDLEAGYEKLWKQMNYELPQSSTEVDFQDRLSLESRAALFNTRLELGTDIYDFKDTRTSLSLEHQFQTLDLGAYGLANTSGKREFNATKSIFNPLDTLYTISTWTPYTAAVYTRVKALKPLRFIIAGGIKQVYNALPYRMASSGQVLNIEYESKIPFTDICIEAKKTLGGIEFDARQSLGWQAWDEDLREIPQYRYNTFLVATRRLEHNNALFGGMALTGHSSYLSKSTLNYVITNSAIVDMWLGFRITNLFELTFSFRNLGDGAIYGVYPIPQSMHATLRWFFMN
ncbi:MAG: hypothetical protein PHI68_00775 [Candidatus Cloacimonetes bacterium]|nr:hypothetical protein [Candidatus Cloacimonadota bacterium]